MNEDEVRTLGLYSMVFGPRPSPTDADLRAQETILGLIQDGYLIGVEVFGTDGCCAHPHDEDCPSAGFGLCDMFGPHSVGSDCNRANRVLMRPADIIDFASVAAELTREAQ